MMFVIIITRLLVYMLVYVLNEGEGCVFMQVLLVVWCVRNFSYNLRGKYLRHELLIRQFGLHLSAVSLG